MDLCPIGLRLDFRSLQSPCRLIVRFSTNLMMPRGTRKCNSEVLNFTPGDESQLSEPGVFVVRGSGGVYGRDMFISAIMTEPDLAEWMWLIGTVLFIIAAVLAFDRTPREWPSAIGFLALGLAFTAFGWVAV